MQLLVAEMLDGNVISPTQSPWASPIVLVSKRDGGTRFCVDYRKLNSVTKLDVFPLPRIDDCLDVLSGTRYFSTLDLSSGFWQVKMEAESAEKTAFVTHCGSYQFNVMPFGLVNVPSTFQRLMEKVMSGLMPEKCLTYIDDILVVGTNFSEHLSNLEAVFERLREASLKLKSTKCKLIQREVTYLGYRVSEDGMSADPAKLDAVKTFPIPTDVKKVRSFVGLASYYRRFVPDFAKIARPLHNLTKNARFQWTDDCQRAFEQLKEALVTAPVLAYPDFSRPFRLETDASGEGLGAVLSQEQADGTMRPIAYASRSLQGAEARYPATELEALGVVWAVKKLRHYLYGHQCTIVTDHQPLRSLLNTPHPSGKLARWGLALQELDVRIVYRPGKKNQAADALSRAPIENGLELDSDMTNAPNAICVLGTQSRRLSDGVVSEPRGSQEQSVEAIDSAPSDECEGRASSGTPGGPVGSAQAWVPETEDARLVNQQDGDEEVSEIVKYLEIGELPEDERKARRLVKEREMYTVADGVLYRVQPDKTLLMYVPTAERRRLFEEVHAGRFAAHQRTAKIQATLMRHYWWPGMRRDIESWCRACVTCWERSAKPPPKPPLTPLPVGGPFNRVGVDILKMPRTSRGHQYVLVFIDYLTKWVEAFPLRDQTALTIARTLVEKVITVHGVPREILSDRGANFLSNLMAELYKLLGTRKVNTTAYHPKTDGLVERFHRTLLDMLSKAAVDRARDWDLYLPYILFSYRVTEQESTKASPFMLLYGREAKLPTTLVEPPDLRDYETPEGYLKDVQERMSAAWDNARRQIEKAQERQKDQYDRQTEEVQFREGDTVYLFMPAKLTGEMRKLNRPNEGPFQIVRAHDTYAEVVRKGRGRKKTLRVAWERLRRCPPELLTRLEEEASWEQRLRPRVRWIETRTSDLRRGRCNVNELSLIKLIEVPADAYPPTSHPSGDSTHNALFGHPTPLETAQ